VPAVVWRFEEHRLPQLVVAAGARDPDVSHAAAPPGGLPAGSQRHGVQLTGALPAHSWCPNGQDSGLFSNPEANI
jgi:hypothetical protein